MSAAPSAPQNLDAEEYVIGAVLVAGAYSVNAGASTLAAIETTGLRLDDFYRKSHGLIYEAALRVAARGEPTDVLMVEDELRRCGRLYDLGSDEQLHDLAALVPAFANADHYARLVVEAADRRKQAEAGAKLQAAARNGSLTRALREEIARVLEPARAKATDDPTITVTEFVARRDESTAEPLVSSAQGTALPPGGLAILAAKVHDGKTTLAVEFVLHASAGCDYLGLSFPRPLNVLVIENEGPREAFRAKLVARLAHWEHGGEPLIWDSPAEWGQVRISDPAMRDRLRAVAAAREIDLIVSDSLTRFGVRGNGTPEETREFIEWLTVLGLGRDVAFLLLHHPRTRPEPGETELERLAGAWPPHADLILLLQKLGEGRSRLSFPKTRWANADRPPSILAFDRATESFSHVGDDVPEERDYLTEVVELMDDGEWWTVNALRKPKDRGGIGAAPDAIKQALSDKRFESTSGDTIGLRKDSTYYRLRQASRPPGDARDASTLRSDEEQASPSPPSKRGLGGDACSDRTTSPGDGPADEDEIERLADLSVEAQHAAEGGGEEEER